VIKISHKSFLCEELGLWGLAGFDVSPYGVSLYDVAIKMASGGETPDLI